MLLSVGYVSPATLSVQTTSPAPKTLTSITVPCSLISNAILAPADTTIIRTTSATLYLTKTLSVMIQWTLWWLFISKERSLLSLTLVRKSQSKIAKSHPVQSLVPLVPMDTS